MIEGDRHWVFSECVTCGMQVSFRKLEDVLWEEEAIQDIDDVVDVMRNELCPACACTLYRGAIKCYPHEDGLKLPDLRKYPCAIGDVFTLFPGEPTVGKVS